MKALPIIGIFSLLSNFSLAFIDGVKLRFGSYKAEHTIETDFFKLQDADEFSQLKIPVMIAFRPRLGKYTFTQFFFDYELPYASLNMNPRRVSKSDLESSFFNSTELNFATANPDYSITADTKTFAAVFGIQYGIFYPISKNSQLFKLGIGATLGWYDYKITFYQCSTYTRNPREITGSSKSSGDCEDKTTIDSVEYGGPGLGLTLNFVFFDYLKDDWAYTIGEFDIGSIRAVKEKKLKGRPTELRIKKQTTLVSIDLVRVTMFF